MEDRRKQFNNFILEDIIKRFKDVVNRKYGYYAKNQWSYEVERMLRYYISVGGIFPEGTHAHTNSHEKRTKEVKDTPEIKTSIMVKNNGEERSHYGPMEESPLIKSWFLTQGIDVDNPDSVAPHIIEEDIETANKMLENQEFAKQFIKDSALSFGRKKGGIIYEDWKTQRAARDKALRPELSIIKIHLRDADMSLNDNTPLSRIQIYNAFIVATNKRDNRTFSVRLREYIDHGYFRAIGTSENKFKATDSLLQL